MITSQIWALLGIYKANHFRAVSPLVVPMHIILYSIHMLQEEFDIYDKVCTLRFKDRYNRTCLVV